MPQDNTKLSPTTMETHACHYPDADVIDSVEALNDPELVKFGDGNKATARDNSLPRIYIASKTKHAPRWRRLRSEGYNIISTWIDEAGARQTSNYSELSVRCIREIRQSDFLIFYCEHEEMQNGALIEMGVALAFGIEVRCVVTTSADVNKVFRWHPAVREFSDIYAALENK